ncbi:MAG: DUF4157 domain-containing protein [Bacteroidetes bacterium]|nr:DUF4157 domain-containing protein [Bacteroidota bacterium]
MADRVMRMSSISEKPVTGLIGKSLQRKCTHCEHEEERKKLIMRKAEAGISGITVSSSFAASLNASKGGGSPLPQGTKSFMENAFSTDFSFVKIHNGGQASEMSKGINARAFTYGSEIYFAADQYSPNTYSGKSLLAHELTHVVQQENNKSNLIHRKENILNKKIVKITAFQGQLKGQALLSDNTVVSINLSKNTLEEPGTYLYFFDAGMDYNYRRNDLEERKGAFLWYSKSVYGKEYHEAAISEQIEVVIIEGDASTQQAKIDALPFHVKNFLTKGTGNIASYAEIEDTINAAFILEINGVTEDELLLYEIDSQKAVANGISESAATSEWAVDFVNKRQEKMDEALSNREAFRAQYLKDYVDDKGYERILGSDKWGIDFAKIKSETPGASNVSDDIILKTFEYELKSNTQTFLSQVLLVLLKIEKRFITDSTNVSVGKNALESALLPLRTALEQKESAEAEYAELQIQRGIAKAYKAYSGDNGHQIITLDGQIEEAKDDFESKSKYLLNVSNSVKLPVLDLPNFSLHALVKANKGEQQGLLKSFLFDARQKIEKANELMNDTKYLYKADKMVKFTKANLGIREKSYSNALINKKIESATEDSTFEQIVNIASILAIFIPGGIGVLIRMGVSAVNMGVEFEKYDAVSTMHSTHLSSQEPSMMGSVLAVGGAFLDANDLAKGVVKVMGAETEAAVKVADDLTADTVLSLERSETRIGWDGRIMDAIPATSVKGISGEAAQKVSAIAKRENLFIRFRPVDEGVVRLRSLGHPAKPEFLKMKTIKKIDVELGAREIDIDQVGFFTPKKPANFDQLPLSHQEELTARFESRMKEITDYSDQVKQLESDGIIRREGNVIVDVKTGKGYTGDYDLFDIRKGGKDGENISFESLSPELQAELEGSSVEVQHGAAIDWDVPEGYAGSYADQVIGGRPVTINPDGSIKVNKPLVEFNPDGTVSEGYFDD